MCRCHIRLILPLSFQFTAVLVKIPRVVRNGNLPNRQNPHDYCSHCLPFVSLGLLKLIFQIAVMRSKRDSLTDVDLIG